MNPIGIRNRKQLQAVRNNYIANLALEHSNNQQSTNAVKILKETGESPTKDTNPLNTTERYQGLEGKKQLLRDSLASNNIMSSHVADDVISSLKAPELDFFSQYKEFLLKDFKGKNVPAKVFIDYLRRYIRKTNETKGVEYSLQQDSGNLLIDSRLAEQDDLGDEFLNDVKDDLSDAGVEGSKISMILKKLRDIQSAQLGEAERQSFDEIQASNDAVTTAEIFELQSQIEEHTPTKEDIMDALQSVKRGDIKPFLDLTDGLSLIAPAHRELIGILNSWVPIAPAVPLAIDTESEGEESKESEEEVAAGGSSSEEEEADGFDDFKALSTNGKRDALIGMGESADEMRKIGDADLIRLYIRRMTPVPVGSGLRGRGLGPKRKPAPVVYKKQPAYKQFGRYILNHNKLHDNVLMVKTPASGYIKELPTKAISHNMTRAVKTIASGRGVTLAEYHALNEDEKSHLHHLAKHSRVETDLPNPKQSDDDADLRRFEILRGENLAGNDSSVIKKELKELLKKFVSEGRLPRQQVNAILMEMI